LKHETKRSFQIWVTKVSFKISTSKPNRPLESIKKNFKVAKRLNKVTTNPSIMDNFILKHHTFKTLMDNRPNVSLKRSTRRTVKYCV
jgi:hypothetical protein